MLNHFKPVDGHNPLKIYSKNPLRLSLHHLQRPVMEANQRKSTGQILKSTVHPWKWTWNIIMEVWKIMFLPKWVICRFHVNLPGCKKNGPNHDLLSMNHLLERFPEQQKQTLLATFNITIKIYQSIRIYLSLSPPFFSPHGVFLPPSTHAPSVCDSSWTTACRRQLGAAPWDPKKWPKINVPLVRCRGLKP